MARDHDIEILNSLITTTIDSALGFERSGEDVRDGPLDELFRDFAAERRQVVALLQATVGALGGTPNDDGSLKADLHRRWVDLRAATSGHGGVKGVIEEVERGEDYLKGKYDGALADNALGEEAREAIRGAYESVREGHDTASALKDSLQGAE